MSDMLVRGLIRANLTGKEYAKLMEFLQRWQLRR